MRKKIDMLVILHPKRAIIIGLIIFYIRNSCGAWKVLHSFLFHSANAKAKASPTVLRFNPVESFESTSRMFQYIPLEMRKRRIDPIMTQDYNRSYRKHEEMIRCCKKTGNWRLAAFHLNQIQQMGFVGSSRMITTVMANCNKNAQYQKTIEIFQNALGLGFEPNTFSYNAVLVACERSGKWKMTIRIMDHLQYSHFRGDRLTYTHAISSCLHSFTTPTQTSSFTTSTKNNKDQRALDAGIKLFCQMKKMNFRPTATLCAKLVMACCQGGRVEEGSAIMLTHRSVFTRPNRYLYSLIISGFAELGRMEDTMVWINRVKREGLLIQKSKNFDNEQEKLELHQLQYTIKVTLELYKRIQKSPSNALYPHHTLKDKTGNELKRKSQSEVDQTLNSELKIQQHQKVHSITNTSLGNNLENKNITRTFQTSLRRKNETARFQKVLEMLSEQSFDAMHNETTMKEH